MLVAAFCVARLVGSADAAETVIDIPTRSGISQRFLYLAPEGKPKAAAILFAGGHGALMIFPNGSIGWADRSFLVRNRSRFAEKGIAVALVDAPSDKRSGMNGFRHTEEHAADVGAVIAWLRQRAGTPVWLVGHSRGTESTVAAGLKLGASPAGPDGMVLASAILSETMFVSGKAVTYFPLEQLAVPVLVVHHEADSCSVTPPRDLPALVSRLPASLPRKSVIVMKGGQAPGGTCDMDAHHSYGGQDEAAIDAIAAFILNQ